MQPPQTYHQWMACFQQLEESPWDKETLMLIPLGTYDARPTDVFLVRISDTVSAMLSKCIRRFLQKMDQLLADRELDMAVLLAVRFRKQLADCLFYRKMHFLERGYVHTLDEGFENQVEAFWKDFLNQLSISVRESMDPGFEDMALELRRIKIIDRRSEVTP